MYRLSQLNEYLRIHFSLFMNLQLANDEGVLDQELTLPVFCVRAGVTCAPVNSGQRVLAL